MTPPKEALLTVILAAKDPDPGQFDACVASIAALRNSSLIDLVIVSGGGLPELPKCSATRVNKIKIINQKPSGIYPAYNRGLDEVYTPYLMVLGCDDLLLPGMDKAIDSIVEGNRPHLIAACALMQDIGIKGPSSFRWGLIFRNWCQQALLYRSDIFSVRRFDCRYPAQADHKLNMELVADRGTVIERRRDVVCHFSSGGRSQTHHDWAFRQDMPDMVRAYYGPFFWVISLMRRRLADFVKRRARTKSDQS